MRDSAVLERGNSRVVLSFAGRGLEAPSFELRRFRASDAAEITAGKEPAKRLFFRESIFRS
jgi:hypothetical protein